MGSTFLRRPQARIRRFWKLNRVASLVFLMALFPAAQGIAETIPTFKFDDVVSLGDMQRVIRTRFPIGSPREALRKTFVVEGGATQKANPLNSNVEKYLFDINLCDYYVWRWNISADYDDQGKLQQAYINGDPVFENGRQKRTPKDLPPGKPTILKGTRLRPEATKGETKLAFVAYDAGSPSQSAAQSNADRLAIGAGPTRADPADMGTKHLYSGVDLWRSIFDTDAADAIHQYQGSCTAADKKYSKRKFALPMQT